LVIPDWPFAIDHLPSTICHRPFAIGWRSHSLFGF